MKLAHSFRCNAISLAAVHPHLLTHMDFLLGRRFFVPCSYSPGSFQLLVPLLSELNHSTISSSTLSLPNNVEGFDTSSRSIISKSRDQLLLNDFIAPFQIEMRHNYIFTGRWCFHRSLVIITGLWSDISTGKISYE